MFLLQTKEVSDFRCKLLIEARRADVLITCFDYNPVSSRDG